MMQHKATMPENKLIHCFSLTKLDFTTREYPTDTVLPGQFILILIHLAEGLHLLLAVFLHLPPVLLHLHFKYGRQLPVVFAVVDVHDQFQDVVHGVVVLQHDVHLGLEMVFAHCHKHFCLRLA